MKNELFIKNLIIIGCYEKLSIMQFGTIKYYRLLFWFVLHYSMKLRNIKNKTIDYNDYKYYTIKLPNIKYTFLKYIIIQK